MEFFIGVVLLILATFFIILMVLACRIVRPYEKGIIESFGKYTRTADSGLKFIFPLYQTMAKVDMREAVMDVPPQEVITSDNVVVTVDAVVYTEVTDPVRVRYNVENFYLAVIKLAQTNLRNLVGDMSLDQSLTSREGINVKLRQILDEATDKWGVRVTRVELQRIEPPADVTTAMHRQMKAERDRRATILEADGQRESAIMRAQGVKESRVLEAEGQAEAIKRVADAERYKRIAEAEGQAQGIETVYTAIHNGDPTDDLLAIKYLEALGAIANGQATKIFMPYEASGIMSSIGSIADLFKEKVQSGPKRGIPGPIPVKDMEQQQPGPVFHPMYPEKPKPEPPDQIA